MGIGVRLGRNRWCVSVGKPFWTWGTILRPVQLEMISPSPTLSQSVSVRYMNVSRGTLKVLLCIAAAIFTIVIVFYANVNFFSVTSYIFLCTSVPHPQLWKVEERVPLGPMVVPPLIFVAISAKCQLVNRRFWWDFFSVMMQPGNCFGWSLSVFGDFLGCDALIGNYC